MTEVSHKDSCGTRLKIGDIVRLNSGGPKFMIVDVDTPEDITVARYLSNNAIEEFSGPSVCFTCLHVLE
jgi:hypothetical protein